MKGHPKEVDERDRKKDKMNFMTNCVTARFLKTDSVPLISCLLLCIHVFICGVFND